MYRLAGCFSTACQRKGRKVLIWEAWLTVGVLAGVFGILVATRAAADMVFLGGLAVLLLAGVVAPREAFAGLSNEGVITLASFISPFRSDRRIVRELFEPDEFLEVYVSAPLAVCEDRDPKGLYRKARNGQISNFTGVDSPYEPPEGAEVVLDTAGSSPEACADLVINHIVGHGYIDY